MEVPGEPFLIIQNNCPSGRGSMVWLQVKLRGLGGSVREIKNPVHSRSCHGKRCRGLAWYQSEIRFVPQKYFQGKGLMDWLTGETYPERWVYSSPVGISAKTPTHLPLSLPDVTPMSVPKLSRVNSSIIVKTRKDRLSRVLS